MSKKRKGVSLIVIVVLFCFNDPVSAQLLNRQMFSSQGKNVVLKNGLFVSQSIGQQSVFGSFSNSKFIVQQGFQQSSVSKITTVIPTALALDAISIQVYPNPVMDILNFKFSSEIKGIIKIAIFDMFGRLLYSGNQNAIGTILTLEGMERFANGVYLVNLTAPNYKYSTKIIKK